MNGRTFNREAALQAGYTEEEINEYLQPIEAYKSGMSLKDVPIGERVGVISRLKEAGVEYVPEEERKAKIKHKEEFRRVNASLGNLLKEFGRIPETQKGPFEGFFAKKAPFGLAAQATEYEEARAGFAGTLKGLVGEVGRLTDEDIVRIMDILPKGTDTNEQADIATGRLSNILVELYGEDVVGESLDWDEKKETVEKAGRNPVLEFFLGPAIDVAQDIGAGIAVKDISNSLEVSIEAANSFYDDAQKTADPKEKARLEKMANDTLNEVGFNVKKIESLFSKSIGEAYISRGLKAGLAVAGTAAMISSLLNFGQKILQKRAVIKVTHRGIGEKVVKVGEKVEKAMPKSFLGRKQAEAAAKLKGVKIDNKSLLEAGKKLALQDPDVAKEFAKQKPFINKIKDIPSLLNRMQAWGRTAYLRGGGVKSAAKAGLYDDFYRVGTEILKTSAPEVHKYRSLLRFSYNLPKAAGKALWKLTLGRITLGGF